MPCTDGKRQWISKEIRLDAIENHLFINNKFLHAEFDLYELQCNWLDGDVDLSMPQQIVGSDGLAVIFSLPLPMGANFPLKPQIDREGVLYNSFQKSLAMRIIQLHNRLVSNSSSFNSHDWLYDLISLVSNCVSLVDITLNQLYLKAEHDPLPGWKFDKAVLGERIHPRLSDKFRWIGQISGNSLDNSQKEMKSFTFLRELRNHTQHFDPPCFGFTLQEVANWLNLVRDIGSLLCNIRRKLNSPLNERIIELMLLPPVIFNGQTLFDRKRTDHINTGYETTKWK